MRIDIYQLYKEVLHLINDNSNYVNLHYVINLGLCNKLIPVTWKQVLELYIIVIEYKTLYSLHIPHTAFPNATKATTKATTNEVHVTKDRDIGTSHIIWWRIWATGFYPTTKEKLTIRRKEDLTTFNSSEDRKEKLKFGFV